MPSVSLPIVCETIILLLLRLLLDWSAESRARPGARGRARMEMKLRYRISEMAANPIPN